MSIFGLSVTEQREKARISYHLLKPHFANLRIDKVEEDKVIGSFNRDDGTLIKELMVEKGKQNYYRPMSMDGGYEYILKFTRF